MIICFGRVLFASVSLDHQEVESFVVWGDMVALDFMPKSRSFVSVVGFVTLYFYCLCFLLSSFDSFFGLSFWGFKVIPPA